MFEITELKAKTLTDLQEIAKTIGLSKVSQLKKLDLVYQILDTQASNLASQEIPKAEKPRRKRVHKSFTQDADTTVAARKEKSQEPKSETKADISEEPTLEEVTEKPAQAPVPKVAKRIQKEPREVKAEVKTDDKKPVHNICRSPVFKL